MCHDLPPLHLWRRLLLRCLPGHPDLRLARRRAGYPADRPDPGPRRVRGAGQSSARPPLGVARPPGGPVPALLRLPAGAAARPAPAGARGVHPAAGPRAARPPRPPAAAAASGPARRLRGDAPRGPAAGSRSLPGPVQPPAVPRVLSPPGAVVPYGTTAPRACPSASDSPEAPEAASGCPGGGGPDFRPTGRGTRWRLGRRRPAVRAGNGGTGVVVEVRTPRFPSRVREQGPGLARWPYTRDP